MLTHTGAAFHCSPKKCFFFFNQKREEKRKGKRKIYPTLSRFQIIILVSRRWRLRAILVAGVPSAVLRTWVVRGPGSVTVAMVNYSDRWGHQGRSNCAVLLVSLIFSAVTSVFHSRANGIKLLLELSINLFSLLFSASLHQNAERQICSSPNKAKLDS